MVGFDRMGLCEGYGLPSDEARYPILVGLLNKGYADKIVLSTDSCAVLLGRPNMALSVFAEPSHIFTSVIPELKKQGITDEQINTMMVENPCRIFSH